MNSPRWAILLEGRPRLVVPPWRPSRHLGLQSLLLGAAQTPALVSYALTLALAILESQMLGMGEEMTLMKEAPLSTSLGLMEGV